MSLPEPTALEAFELLCHEVSNPLMVVSGHAHLLERDVLRLTSISDVERNQLLVDLASITGNLQAAVLLMEQERWRLTNEDELP